MQPETFLQPTTTAPCFSGYQQDLFDEAIKLSMLGYFSVYANGKVPIAKYSDLAPLDHGEMFARCDDVFQVKPASFNALSMITRGLVCLDADTSESKAALRSILKNHGIDVKFCVQSPNGVHVYLKEQDTHLARQLGKDSSKFPSFIDIKRGNNTATLPPTVRADKSRQYEYLKHPCHISELPTASLELLQDIYYHNGLDATGGKILLDRTANIVQTPLKRTPADFKRINGLKKAGYRVDTPDEIREKVLKALDSISADISNLEWLRVIAAIKATGLSDTMRIAREWSKTAPHRFDANTFNVQYMKADPSKAGIKSGAGWLIRCAAR